MPLRFDKQHSIHLHPPFATRPTTSPSSSKHLASFTILSHFDRKQPFLLVRPENQANNCLPTVVALLRNVKNRLETLEDPKSLESHLPRRLHLRSSASAFDTDLLDDLSPWRKARSRRRESSPNVGLATNAEAESLLVPRMLTDALDAVAKESNACTRSRNPWGGRGNVKILAAPSQ